MLMLWLWLPLPFILVVFVLMLMLWLTVAVAKAMVTLPEILVLFIFSLLLVSTGAAGDGESRPVCETNINCRVLGFFGLALLNFLAVGLVALRSDDSESNSDCGSDSDSDSDCSDSDKSENNVTEVFPPDWKFIKTGKSRGDGLLVTHGSFVFHKDSDNRKGDINSPKGVRTFHVCSKKNIGCTATAVTLAKMVKNDAGKLN